MCDSAGVLHESFRVPASSTKKRPHEDHVNANSGGALDSVRSSLFQTAELQPTQPTQPTTACPSAHSQHSKRRRLVKFHPAPGSPPPKTATTHGPGHEGEICNMDQDSPRLVRFKTKLWKCLRSTVRLQKLQNQEQQQHPSIPGSISRQVVNLMEACIRKALRESPRNKDLVHGSLSIRSVHNCTRFHQCTSQPRTSVTRARFSFSV